EGNVLTIHGERKMPEVPKGVWHRQERGFGKFARALELPYPVEMGRVEARFEQGVLFITLPRAEAARPRRIPVKAGGAPVLSPACGPARPGKTPGRKRGVASCSRGGGVMFHLTPWKKGEQAGVPESRRYNYPLARMREEFESLFDRFFGNVPLAGEGFDLRSCWALDWCG